MPTSSTVIIANDTSGTLSSVDFVTLDNAQKRQTYGLGDADLAAAVAKVTNTDPTSAMYGLVVRDIRTPNSTSHRILTGTTTDSTVVKASPGNLYQVEVYNDTATKFFVKFFDKTTAPNPASDTVKLTIGCQAGLRTSWNSLNGMAFALGIAFAVVTGIADNNSTAVAASAGSVDTGYNSRASFWLSRMPFL